MTVSPTGNGKNGHKPTAPGKNGHGGKREGAGRKPAAQTLARRVLAEANNDTAQEAFDLLVSFMRNEKVATALRIGCAQYIQDRVWGKPTVSIMDDPDLPVLVDDLSG